LPGIGRLSLTGDGHLLFHADAYNRLLAESFGLNPVLCPALASSAKASEPQTAPQAPACPTEGEVTGPKIIPMERWRRLSVTVAAAAAVLLMLCLPLPMGNGDQQWMQQASAIPLPRLEPENVVEATLADAIVAEEEEELGEETPYHLIIGSFRTQHKALQFIKSVPPELQPYILYSDQRYRIAVAAFATEDEGETFLQQFIIARPDYHDAWVLAFQNP
ncbi:MAG: SPOR domain-containing protein, partial [Paludibacteraceae bacterium]|nr:SPOR domain-containing protein [Paludibacteraceae bacterium]